MAGKGNSIQKRSSRCEKWNVDAAPCGGYEPVRVWLIVSMWSSQSPWRCLPHYDRWHASFAPRCQKVIRTAAGSVVRAILTASSLNTNRCGDERTWVRKASIVAINILDRVFFHIIRFLVFCTATKHSRPVPPFNSVLICHNRKHEDFRSRPPGLRGICLPMGRGYARRSIALVKSISGFQHQTPAVRIWTWQCSAVP